MNRISLRVPALLAAFAMAACSGGGSALPTAPVTAGPAQAAAVENESSLADFAPGSGFYPMASPNVVRRACPVSRGPGDMQCFAFERTDLREPIVRESAPGELQPDAAAAVRGYVPADLQQAYALPSSTAGKGKTVAIVDAFGYPAAESDLAKYRAAFRLPPCTRANGCLRIVNQAGGTTLPGGTSWEFEQALDLDMVSAICPNCKILLVQAQSNSFSNLYAADTTAARLGAIAVSNSYGSHEWEGFDSHFVHAGTVFVASAGDDGGGAHFYGATNGTQQPCSLSTVVCVGGTALIRSPGTARGWTEKTWNDLQITQCGGTHPSCGATGSGCSTIVAKPAWQTDHGCTHRAESDVAANASTSYPVAVYQAGWTAAGGTSAASPMVAAMFALAASSSGARTIWAHAGSAALHDVTVGTNLYGPFTGGCSSLVTYICRAGKGYDGPTGNGSPNGLGAF